MQQPVSKFSIISLVLAFLYVCTSLSTLLVLGKAPGLFVHSFLIVSVIFMIVGFRVKEHKSILAIFALMLNFIFFVLNAMAHFLLN